MVKYHSNIFGCKVFASINLGEDRKKTTFDFENKRAKKKKRNGAKCNEKKSSVWNYEKCV